MKRFALAAVVVALCSTAFAAVKTKKVEYKFDGVTFVGHLYWDDASKEKRPGVLVVHEWWGLDDYAKMRAEMLAKMGYVAFACDMYGDGTVVDHPQDAGKMATTVRANLDVWRGRAKESFKQLTEFELTDATRCAAIGYCFGGTTCLQLAASGADLKAIATFHAALPKLKPEDAKAIKAKVQVHHGADDKFIPAQAIADFKKVMGGGNARLDFIEYPGCVHSFTVPKADSHKIDGMKYDKKADEESWAAMTKLFEETLKK